ncbi:MAG: hypothetical protein Q7S36_00510 [Candidatus Liptonbacteria bacterium]|nr:hypothetical protein [Candidatus Liptonbacteria bacterium]
MPLPTQEELRRVSGSILGQGIYRQLLLLAGAILAISLILYGGFSLGYEPYLSGQKDKLDAQIQDFSKRIPLDKQTELIAFYSQLMNVRTLLDRHLLPSNLFNWLETNTQINTSFSKLNFNANNYQLSLFGNSKSPEDVAEQAAIMESQPQVLQLNFNSLGASATGGWQFNVTVYLNQKSFLPSGKTYPLIPPFVPMVVTAPTQPVSAPTSTKPATQKP